MQLLSLLCSVYPSCSPTFNYHPVLFCRNIQLHLNFLQYKSRTWSEGVFITQVFLLLPVSIHIQSSSTGLRPDQSQDEAFNHSNACSRPSRMRLFSFCRTSSLRNGHNEHCKCRRRCSGTVSSLCDHPLHLLFRARAIQAALVFQRNDNMMLIPTRVAIRTALRKTTPNTSGTCDKLYWNAWACDTDCMPAWGQCGYCVSIECGSRFKCLCVQKPDDRCWFYPDPPAAAGKSFRG